MGKKPIIAFSHVPKCGGTTLIHLLRSNYGWRHIDVIPQYHIDGPFCYTAQNLLHDMSIHPFVKSISGHSLYIHMDMPAFVPTLIWYTFLRDPISRLLSHYRDNRRRGWCRNFSEWLERTGKYLCNTQVRHFSREVDVEAAKQTLATEFRMVGLVEYFDQSLLLCKQRLRLTDFNVAYDKPKNRSASGGPSKDQLGELEKYREEIVARTRLDQKLYEFVKNDIWPMQVAEYGGESKLRADVKVAFDCSSYHPSRLRHLHNIAHRNLIYKPFVYLNGRGRRPKKKPRARTSQTSELP